MGQNFLQGFFAVNLQILLKLYPSYKANAVKVYYIALSNSIGINLFPLFFYFKAFFNYLKLILYRIKPEHEIAKLYLVNSVAPYGCKFNI